MPGGQSTIHSEQSAWVAGDCLPGHPMGGGRAGGYLEAPGGAEAHAVRAWGPRAWVGLGELLAGLLLGSRVSILGSERPPDTLWTENVIQPLREADGGHLLLHKGPWQHRVSPFALSENYPSVTLS